ncbi:hypothetical protein AB5I41_24495 [Sphingomonas sp. MMS24-JH45]
MVAEAAQGRRPRAIADLYAHGPVEAVIEERLEGPEASLFVLSDGTSTASFGSAQDHKRVGDGDTGPNTGGMGADSPAHERPPSRRSVRWAQIGADDRRAGRGGRRTFLVLYAGLNAMRQGPKLIDMSASAIRKAQAPMVRYDGDLAALLLAVARGRLADEPVLDVPRRAAALTVVMAAKGYPYISKPAVRSAGSTPRRRPARSCSRRARRRPVMISWPQAGAARRRPRPAPTWRRRRRRRCRAAHALDFPRLLSPRYRRPGAAGITDATASRVRGVGAGLQ